MITIHFDLFLTIVEVTLVFILTNIHLPVGLYSEMVTSLGGTTAEAITAFEKGGFVDLVQQAVTAAYEKAWKLQ